LVHVIGFLFFLIIDLHIRGIETNLEFRKFLALLPKIRGLESFILQFIISVEVYFILLSVYNINVI